MATCCVFRQDSALAQGNSEGAEVSALSQCSRLCELQIPPDKRTDEAMDSSSRELGWNREAFTTALGQASLSGKALYLVPGLARATQLA